jgi:YfiH family protein
MLQSELLSRETGSLHLFSLRNPELPGYGNTSLTIGNPAKNYLEESLLNRKSLLSRLGLAPTDLTLAFQEHGIGIIAVTEKERGRGALSGEDCVGKADGLITAVPGLAVGVLVADCCCLLMADTHQRAVGAFHAGWRGTYAGMAQTAVKTFQDSFGIPADDLRIWVGPTISGKNYAVSEDLWKQFKEKWGEGEYLMCRGRPLGLPCLDLVALTTSQLHQVGIRPEAVESAGICTYESPQCFSHRRGDSPPGRMLGMIALAS